MEYTKALQQHRDDSNPLIGNHDRSNAEKVNIQMNDLLTSLSSIGYNQNTLNARPMKKQRLDLNENKDLSQPERDLIRCLLSDAGDDDIRDRQYSRIKNLTS